MHGGAIDRERAGRRIDRQFFSDPVSIGGGGPYLEQEEEEETELVEGG
jgi:hypothetical protein